MFEVSRILVVRRRLLERRQKLVGHFSLARWPSFELFQIGFGFVLQSDFLSYSQKLALRRDFVLLAGSNNMWSMFAQRRSCRISTWNKDVKGTSIGRGMRICCLYKLWIIAKARRLWAPDLPSWPLIPVMPPGVGPDALEVLDSRELCVPGTAVGKKTLMASHSWRLWHVKFDVARYFATILLSFVGGKIFHRLFQRKAGVSEYLVHTVHSVWVFEDFYQSLKVCVKSVPHSW